MSPQKTEGPGKKKKSKSTTKPKQARSKKKSAKNPEQGAVLETAVTASIVEARSARDISDALPPTSSSEALFSEAVLHSALRLLVERAETNQTELICADCNADPESDECDLYRILPNNKRVFLKTVSKAFASRYHPCG